MQWTECSLVTFCPKKVFKTESSGVDEQSIHLEIKSHNERSKPKGRALGRHFVGVERLFTAKFNEVSNRFSQISYFAEF
jgi:hypothetical protein